MIILNDVRKTKHVKLGHVFSTNKGEGAIVLLTDRGYRIVIELEELDKIIKFKETE